MTIALDYKALDYNPEVYTGLLSLGNATRKLRELDGLAHINGRLKDILHAHGATARFGICLLHKHFDLKPGEQLVHFGNVAIPCTVASLSPELQGKMRPSSFVLTPAGAAPIEFTYSPRPPHNDMRESDVDMVRAFAAAVSHPDVKLESVLGLTLVDAAYTPRVEITEGAANIALPAEVDAALPHGGESIQASWVFKADEGEDGNTCVSPPCSDVCKALIHDEVVTRV